MALNVVSVEPIDNSNFPIDGYIRLQFDTQVKPEYFDSISNVTDYFQLYNKTTQTKTALTVGYISTDLLTLFIKPTNDLDPLTDYTLVVLGGTTGIQNISNELLSTNYIYTLTTTDALADTTLYPPIIFDGVDVTYVQTDPIDPVADSVTDPTVSTIHDAIASSESGTDNRIISIGFEDDGSSLFLEYSNPEHLDVGAADFSGIGTTWSENVEDRYVANSRLSRSNLPYTQDPFADNSLPFTPTITNNDIYFMVSETGMPTANYEYTLSIPKGAIKDVNDAAIRNDKTIIKFMGPLSPLFALPDDIRFVINNANDSFENSFDDYTLYKKIHQISYELVYRLGYIPDFTDPLFFWATKYVICKTVYDLIRGPFSHMKYVSYRKILGQSVSWQIEKASDDPLKDCMDKSLFELGLTRAFETLNGVKSSTTKYYPGRKRTDDIL